MNKLAKLIKRLLVIARAPDTKYLIGLNLQAIQKIKGKPGPNDNPREFYQNLQQEATKGPIFLEPTLKFMDKLDLELTKDEVKWIATRYQKKAKIDPNTLRNVLDYIRSEKPKLDTLSYTKAVAATRQWHEQFKGKADSTGEYNTKNVILKLTNGYTWVEVPAEDLKTEGSNMGHCVGGSDYVSGVKNGSTKILSLRDASNKPHVTIELNRKGSVIQVQGKENKEPITKYHIFIEQLWNHLKIEHNESTAKYITNPELLTKLVASKKYKKYVALNPNLSVDTMKALSVDKDIFVRRNLALNTGLTEQLISKLLNDPDLRTRSSVASNPGLSPERMRSFASHRNILTRSFLARNPNLPPDLMKLLAKDDEEEVRCALALRNDLPGEIIEILSKDHDPEVLHAVASYPDLPIEIVRNLAKSKEPDVLSAIAERENLPVDVLSSLAKSKKWEVLTSIANNPLLDVEDMEILAKNNNVNVRCVLAENPKLPLEIMRLLAHDKDVNVLNSLIETERLPMEVLEILANSKHAEIRTMAEEELEARLPTKPKKNKK
jgi:hypothetical protein